MNILLFILQLTFHEAATDQHDVLRAALVTHILEQGKVGGEIEARDRAWSRFRHRMRETHS